MKVGSGTNFIKMKGGNAGKSDTEDIDAMAALLKKGMFNAGAFQTADCRKTFEELKAKGVEFVSEPKDQFSRKLVQHEPAEELLRMGAPFAGLANAGPSPKLRIVRSVKYNPL
jgi:hypothetical protein